MLCLLWHEVDNSSKVSRYDMSSVRFPAGGSICGVPIKSGCVLCDAPAACHHGVSLVRLFILPPRSTLMMSLLRRQRVSTSPMAEQSGLGSSASLGCSLSCSGIVATKFIITFSDAVRPLQHDERRRANVSLRNTLQRIRLSR